MIVQWCLKGMYFDEEDQAREIIDSRAGLQCNWWRGRSITAPQIRDKLTDTNLDMHVNHFDELDHRTRKPFSAGTPFVSLSAGTIERDTVVRTNFAHSAYSTALYFGTEFGRRDTAYLFRCWVVVGPRSAVGVESVAEEIRDLNTYRRFSPYQTEGEIVAKIHVPDNQLWGYERWTWNTSRKHLRPESFYLNPRFTHPTQLSNVRGLI